MNRKSKIQNLKWAGFLAIVVLLVGYVGMADAQQAKVHQVGAIHLGGPLSTMIEGLRDGLRELGLQEGKQFVLTIQDTKGDQKTVEEAARKFEREKVKLIYAVTTPVVAAAMKVTKDVPIVFSVGSDPVAAGFVQSFVKPGGRLTGVHYLARDLTGKRLEILKEILPKLRTVVTFYDPNDRVAREAAQLGREEAKRQGINFVE